jgi:L-cystine uptake protein TcyP (sodium:dicarboxylate symporter family)
VTDPVAHSCKMTGKFMASYILINLMYVLFPLLTSCQKIGPSLRLREMFRNMISFYGEVL